MNKKLETIKNKVTKTANVVLKKLEPVAKKIGPVIDHGFKFLHSATVVWLAAMVIRLFIMVVTTGATAPALLLVLMLGALISVA